MYQDRYYDPDDRGRRPGGGDTAQTVQRLLRHAVAYLRARPAESWWFFAAGFLVATLL